MVKQAPLILVLFVVVLCISSFVSGTCPGIFARFQWGARPPKEIVNMSMPLPNVVVHHTVMGDGNCSSIPQCMLVMKEIQDFHMDDREWSDIGYSFLVGAEGSIFEGRGWLRVGAHAPGFNDRSIGISLIGDFTSVLPSEVQMNSAKALIDCGIELGHIIPNYSMYGHRDVSNTDCPGDRFYEEISSWPHKQTTAPPINGYTAKME